MSSAVTLRDVVGVAERVLLIGVVPLHSQLDLHLILRAADVYHLAMQWILVAIEVLHESRDPALVLEKVLRAIALVAQQHAHARVEKGEFP